MIVGQIKSKYLTKDLRLNSGYFLNANAINSRVLEENIDKCIVLEDLAKVFNPPIFKRQFCQNSIKAIPYCQSSSVTNYLEGSDIYINKIQALKVGSIVKTGQILITGFGTIGNTRLVNELSEGLSYANNVCRVESYDNSNFGYLYAFLSSKYGKSQLNKNGSGSVVLYIESPGVKKTLVPKISDSLEKLIHNQILSATDLRVEANKIFAEAQAKLKSLLDISEDEYVRLISRTEKDISNAFVIKSSTITANTLRARNYSPRKQKIIDILKSKNHVVLGKVLTTSPFYGARYKRIESFSEKSVELLSQGNIFDIKPKGRSISIKSIKNIDQEIAKKGTILIPGQGTLGENEIFGRAKFVWGYLEGKVIAGHAMRFIPDETKISSGYLYCILNSPLWFRLLRNTVYGTNLLGFIVPLLNDLPIPRFDILEENYIDSLIKKAYEKMTLANEIEDKAIATIEKEIESWQ